LGVVHRDASNFQKALQLFRDAYELDPVEDLKIIIEDTEYYQTWVKCFSNVGTSFPEGTHPIPTKPEIIFVLGGPGAGTLKLSIQAILFFL
jgi:hypothetical protein